MKVSSHQQKLAPPLLSFTSNPAGSIFAKVCAPHLLTGFYFSLLSGLIWEVGKQGGQFGHRGRAACRRGDQRMSPGRQVSPSDCAKVETHGGSSSKELLVPECVCVCVRRETMECVCVCVFQMTT